MSPAPYYMGDTVPLKFTISDESGDVEPVNCTCKILMPNNKMERDCPCKIAGNIVSHLIPSSQTVLSGHYEAYFILTLMGGMIRTHKMEFDIIRNPEKERGI